MSVPSAGEEFAKLVEFLRKAQEAASRLAHLKRDESRLQAQGWLAVSEMLGHTVIQVTKLATRGLQ